MPCFSNKTTVSTVDFALCVSFFETVEVVLFESDLVADNPTDEILANEY